MMSGVTGGFNLTPTCCPLSSLASETQTYNLAAVSPGSRVQPSPSDPALPVPDCWECSAELKPNLRED